MNIAWMNISSYTTYFFLLLSIISLWFKRAYVVWGSLFLVALVLGLIEARLQWFAIPIILGFALLCIIAFKQKFPPGLRILSGTLVCMLSLLLGQHQLPGFNNLKVLSNITFSPNAYPYTLYYNFDTAIVGLFILGFGWDYINQAKSFKSIKATFTKVIYIILLMLIVLMGLSLLMNYVQLDVKTTPLFWVWAIANLFFTCVPEEVLFRGLIQNTLARALPKHTWAAFLAIFLTALLFGLAHFAFGLKFMLLAFIAGLFYGWVYHATKRIEASILAHFILNATHFLAFTYPGLKTLS